MFWSPFYQDRGDQPGHARLNVWNPVETRAPPFKSKFTPRAYWSTAKNRALTLPHPWALPQLQNDPLDRFAAGKPGHPRILVNTKLGAYHSLVKGARS